MTKRGFETSEYRSRLARAQRLMGKSKIDAILLTTHPQIYYFTGFLTRFWESPTRPWFLLLPQTGDPVAVIPSIGAALMAKSWLSDIRTWRSPDLSDDGVTLLAQTILEHVPNGVLGIPSGHETHLRMPLNDFQRLGSLLDNKVSISDDGGVIRALQMIKSEAEVSKIKTACTIAGTAFAKAGQYICADLPLSEVFRKFQATCLEEGADWVPYLAGGAGQSGYDDVISPASDEPLNTGDVVMLDTGLVWDGYFCDYDRNFAIGDASTIAKDAHKKLIETTYAGYEAVKPGVLACDVFRAMDKVLTGGAGGNDNGRLGHGLGMQLTEWPSLIPNDNTQLLKGMVLTLEPSVETINGRMMVHEENIVVTETGAQFLSEPWQKELMIL